MKLSSDHRLNPIEKRGLKRRTLLSLIGGALLLPLSPMRTFGAILERHDGGPASTGRWKFAVYKESGPLFDLKFGFADHSYDHNQFAVTTEELVELAGPLSIFGGQKKFVIDRSAGTFTCVGKLGVNAGSGSATFIPRESYVHDLGARGFSLTSARDQLDFALFDITASNVAEWRAIFGDIAPRDVLSLTVLKVPVRYAGEMRSVFPAATTKDVLALQAFGISSTDAAGIQRLRAAKPFSVDDVVKLKAAGISEQYLADLKAVGYGEFSYDDISALFTNKVDAAFIRSSGLSEKGLSAEELIAKKIQR